MAAKPFLSEKWPYVLLLVLALALPYLITNRYAFQIVIMGCLFSDLHPQPEFDPGLHRTGVPGPRRVFRHRVLWSGAHDETWAIVSG